MHRVVRALLAVVVAIATLPASAEQVVHAPRWDGARTPLKIYAPESGANCAPLAMISPGAGGSEDGMQYLAQALSEAGWLTIVLGHEESGPKVVRDKSHKSGARDGLQALTTDAEAYRSRMLDISAALKWIGAPCQTPFSVLIGHSMGAATVMIEAGAKNELGVQGEDRFDAYVAISPQGPGSIFPEHAWKKVRRPTLLLTGTKDKALDGDWRTRTLPFEDLPAGCKWLGVIDGATHMNFAGVGLSGRTEKLTVLAANAFLESARSTGCAMPPPQAKGITFKAK